MFSGEKAEEENRWKEIMDSFNNSIRFMNNLNTFMLKDLELTAEEFKKLIPKLKEIRGLTSLTMEGHKIGALPPEIAELTGLKRLNLRSNELTTVPQELGKLSSLEFLELSGNELTEVPRELNQLSNLIKLGLAHNSLTTVPLEVVALPNLRQLYINENCIAPADFGRIENTLKRHGGEIMPRPQLTTANTEPNSPNPVDLSSVRFTTSGIDPAAAAAALRDLEPAPRTTNTPPRRPSR